MPDPKEYINAVNERNKKENLAREFADKIHRDAEYGRYEQNRIEGKQGLKNMLAYYRGLEKDDGRLAAIMDGLDKLASMNSTSDNSYWRESDAFKNAMKEMDSYLDNLLEQESQLNEESKRHFYNNGHWMSEQEIESSGDEVLQQLNREYGTRQNIIDNKRLLLSDLHNYLQRQTGGELVMEKVEPVAYKKQVKKAEADTQAEKAGAQAEKADTQAEKADTQAEKADTQAEKADTQAEKADTQAEGTGTQTEGTGTQTEGTGAQAERTGTQTEGTGTQTEEADTQAEEAGTQAEKAGTQAEKADTQAEEAGTSAERTGTQAEEAGAPTEKAGARTKEAGTQTEKNAGQKEEPEYVPVYAESYTELTEQDNEKLNGISQPNVYVNFRDYEQLTDPVKEISKEPETLPPTRHIVYTNKQMDLRFYNGSMWDEHMAVKDRKTVNHAQSPLFPHEPCANDISQGTLGDCYYLAALSKVAQLNPEKIKEMMKDNGDGTVSVRLYSKNENGQYAPVYVTVDKVDETMAGDIHRNSENSLWVNCLERALAVSGLEAHSSISERIYEPVPANIEKVYNALKAKKDAGQLTGNNLKRAAQEYPWLFAKNRDKNTLELVPWPSMAAIEGGNSAVALEIILGPGYEAERIPVPEIPKNTTLNTAYTDEQNKAFEKIFHCVQRDMPVTAATTKESPDIKTGYHAYTVMDAYEHEGVKYVRVRNPHGTANEGYESIINENGTVDIKAVNAEQSIYDVEFSAFCRNFPKVFVNGYHRDETSIEIPRPEELKAEKKQTGPVKEKKPEELRKESEKKAEALRKTLELNDSTFIQNPENLGIYLSQELDAELYAGKNPSRMEDVLEKRYSDYSKTDSWERQMINAACMAYPEWNELGNHTLDCLRDDLPNFRNELQKLINESCKKGVSNEGILQYLGKELKTSEQKLVSEGKHPESEKFLKRLVDELKNSTDKLLGQVEKEPLEGERELNEFFNKMKAMHEDPSVPHELYFQPKGFGASLKINSFYRNEQGTCMVALKYGEGEKQITFREAMQRASCFRLKDHRIEAGKGIIKPGESLPPPAEPGREQLSGDMSYESFMQYKKLLNDLDHTLSTEKGWGRKSSPESQALRAALKNVNATIAGKGIIGYNELQQQLNRLTAPLNAYEAHCAANPRRLTRRQNRLKACGMLRDLQQAAQNREKNPLKDYRKEYAERMVNESGKLKKKNYTGPQVKAMAERLLDNPSFRGFMAKQNAFHMKHATDKEIGKDLSKMTASADKYAKKNEEKAIDKVTRSSQNTAAIR